MEQNIAIKRTKKVKVPNLLAGMITRKKEKQEKIWEDFENGKYDQWIEQQQKQ